MDIPPSSAPSVRRFARRQVRQLIHVLDEDQVGAPQVNLVVDRQVALAIEAHVVDARAVETTHVAHAPAPAAERNLGVVAAAQVVLQDDGARRCPPQRIALGRVKREHVAETVVPANHKIGCRADGHLFPFLIERNRRIAAQGGNFVSQRKYDTNDSLFQEGDRADAELAARLFPP